MVEVLLLLGDKRRADKRRHDERLEAAFGADTATSAALSRYADLCAHRCRELRVECERVTEGLDVGRSSLEYDRLLVELLAREARLLLEGRLSAIGDYDSLAAATMYIGDYDDSSELTCAFELTALIKQLIALLENPQLSTTTTTTHRVTDVLAAEAFRSGMTSPAPAARTMAAPAHPAAHSAADSVDAGTTSIASRDSHVTREALLQRAPLTADDSVMVLDSHTLKGSSNGVTLT